MSAEPHIYFLKIIWGQRKNTLYLKQRCIEPRYIEGAVYILFFPLLHTYVFYLPLIMSSWDISNISRGFFYLKMTIKFTSRLILKSFRKVGGSPSPISQHVKISGCQVRDHGGGSLLQGTRNLHFKSCCIYLTPPQR